MRKSKEKDKNNRPIHMRYMELFDKYSSSKNKINHLNDLEGKISKEKYNYFLAKHEAIVNETEPQMISLKSEVEKLIDEYTQELESVSKSIKENKDKTEESDRLFNRGIIDKEQHEEDLTPLLAEKSILERSYNKKSEELSTLKNALIGSLKEGKCVETKFPVVITSTAASKKTTHDGARPLKYFYRFSSLFFLTQIVGVALFGLISFVVFLKKPDLTGLVNLVGGIVFFFMISFHMFKEGKNRFLTHFLTSLFYMVFALFVSSRLWDPQFSSPNIWSIQFWSETFSSIKIWNFDFSSKLVFLNYLSGWNMVVGEILFVLAIIRTFFIGLRSEYANRHD